ncbi:DUF421 domain-containing protein [Virgibacillus sp. DJP39]|uniref:DUF421 domain-containing protein n=1 Tax=Virgibacillus sp. DJP39 TaxID=3409790 RepID=UPI003BB6778F
MDEFITYVLKPLLIFVMSYIFIRVGGKKAVSEMNSFDLLFILVLGTIISEPLVTKKPFEALLYASVFLIVYITFSYSVLNNKLRWLLIASPTVLIRNGDIDEKGLRKVKMTTGELISNLRIKGYENPTDIEIAIMEDMGKLSVVQKSYARPLQPSDIQLHPSPTFIPIPIIMNGQILNHNLKFLQKDNDWLDMQLKAHDLSLDDISGVTLGTYNQQGTLSIDSDNPNLKGTNNPYFYKPGNQN